MKAKNLELLLEAIGEVELPERKLRLLEWLAEWEPETIENICSVIEKIGESVVHVGSLSDREIEAK